MTRTPARAVARFLLLSFAAPLVLACGSSSDSTGPGPSGGNTQTASAVATPAGATVARGGATSATVVYSASSGLTIGSSFGIQRQYSGITVNQTSTQQSGNTITRVYSISPDASVPLGTTLVRFSTTVTGYTGTGTAPTSNADFSLTVTQ